MITVPPLIIWGQDDWMGAFEIGIAALNSIDDSRLVFAEHVRPLPPSEHLETYTVQGLNFLQRT